MSETEKKLIETSYTLCLQNEDEKNDDDIITTNDALLKELSEIWTGHENAMRLLIRVTNAPTVRRMVEKAQPVEIVPLRHELVGAENVLRKLYFFHQLYLRRQNKNEDNTPQGETETSPNEETL